MDSNPYGPCVSTAIFKLLQAGFSYNRAIFFCHNFCEPQWGTRKTFPHPFS